MKTNQLLVVAAACAALSAGAAGWTRKSAPIMTEWGERVTPENAWREYPRPQLVRDNWQNLNGLWDYAITLREAPRPSAWEGEILVPFAVESPLSGVKRLLSPVEQIWYRRTIRADFKPGRERLILHFGGADFRTQVWVNGVEATDAPHEGGILPFGLDITDFAKPGENEIVVSVWDPTEDGDQARGKQSFKAEGGIFYTRVSGIWQTVWTETVPETHVTGYTVVTDIDKGTVSVLVSAAGELQSARMSLRAKLDGKVVATADVRQWTRPTVLAIPNAKLWSPESPTLYDLEIVLESADGARDRVTGYFGMRKVEVRVDASGAPRFHLNNRPYFMQGTLDQGWWPDGLLTPPSEEAMAWDISYLKDVGFNMMRKHIKVEPLRYYHLCDKLGLLVWQDMPSGGGNPHVRYGRYRRDFKEMVDTLQTFPSIVVWVPYNEGWGQPEWPQTGMTYDWIRRYDPTRVIDGPSGWTDHYNGDMYDMHCYRGPGMYPAEERRATVLGEFGGIGYTVKDHIFMPHKRKPSEQPIERMLKDYREVIELLAPMAADGLSASVYTQTTDVEDEMNGLVTYDRKVEKLPREELRKIHETVYRAFGRARKPEMITVFPSCELAPATWAYTMDEPAADWMQPGFDDSAWKRGPGAFESEGERTHRFHGSFARTPWEGKDLWLRRTFDYDGPLENIRLGGYFFCDDGAEVFLNGHKVRFIKDTSRYYEHFWFDKGSEQFLKKGRNTIAVRGWNERGGARMDMSLDVTVNPVSQSPR